MKKITKVLSLLLTSLVIYQIPSEAINISYSDKTKKNSVIFTFRGGSDLPFNLGVSGGIDIYPSYSNIIGLPTSSNLGDERWGILGTAELNLLYNWNLIDAKTFLGNFNPTISPYIGYKHYMSHSGFGGLSLSKLEPTTIFSNIGGINYGLRFTSDLPLGFKVYAEGGATSLLNGGWSSSQSNQSSNMSSGNMILPNASVGANFNLFNIVTARAGYNLRYVPNIRDNNITLSSSDNALVHSFELGLSFLFFSI